VKPSNHPGFTLIEILIVIIIISLLTIGILMNFRTQIAKGRDARRKEDLAKLKTAVEDYYSDHNSYPESLPSCGSSFLPYLETIPCDPKGTPAYAYETDSQSYYKIFARLENNKDPAIDGLNCPGEVYNWGVASAKTAVCN
jgi:prepilin-type N-terminal cleavage/methylation domain-containing protein